MHGAGLVYFCVLCLVACMALCECFVITIRACRFSLSLYSNIVVIQ